MGGEILAGKVHPGPDIRAFRRRLGWNQLEAAKRFGVTVHTLSLWETMRSRPSPFALEKIIDALRDSLLETYKNTTSLLPVPR